MKTDGVNGGKDCDWIEKIRSLRKKIIPLRSAG